ncbi:hypothetical protein HNV12_20600 [Methanococcoides sp. SA1]|nr:hypothetical protein [Methanococcoides sp. SA1]
MKIQKFEMSSKRAKISFGEWGVGVLPLKNSLNPRKHYTTINRFPYRVIEEEYISD